MYYQNMSSKYTKDLINILEMLWSIEKDLNLVRYNETEKNYKRSKNIEKFVTKLNEIKSNYRVLIRWSKGQDIDAACGQLATLNE